MTKGINKHLRAALFTLALTVGVFSIGALVKGSDDPAFASCTPTKFESPQSGSTLSYTEGEFLEIGIKAGSCDEWLELDDRDTTLIPSLGDKKLLKGADGYFRHRVQLNDTGHDASAGLIVEVRKRNPVTGQIEDDFDYEIRFALTVTERVVATSTSQSQTTTTTKPLCPLPKFLQPANEATVFGTALIEVVNRQAHNRIDFTVSGNGIPAIHQASTSRRLRWDTTGVPNGEYVVTASGKCGDGFRSNNDFSILVLNASNQNAPAVSNPEETSTIVYTTPTGETITIRPALLAEPKYRAVIETPKNTKLAINEATPIHNSKGVNEKVMFKGQGEPSAKYTLLVFSEPKQLDFTAGKDGNWQVELNQSLEPGEHEAYIVLNDSKGKPVERSNVLSFVVPTAEAAAANQPQTVTQSAHSRARYYAAYSGLVILAAMLAFFGLQAARRRNRTGKDNFPTPEAPAEE